MIVNPQSFHCPSEKKKLRFRGYTWNSDDLGLHLADMSKRSFFSVSTDERDKIIILYNYFFTQYDNLLLVTSVFKNRTKRRKKSVFFFCFVTHNKQSGQFMYLTDTIFIIAFCVFFFNNRGNRIILSITIPTQILHTCYCLCL